MEVSCLPIMAGLKLFVAVSSASEFSAIIRELKRSKDPDTANRMSLLHSVEVVGFYHTKIKGTLPFMPEEFTESLRQSETYSESKQESG